MNKKEPSHIEEAAPLRFLRRAYTVLGLTLNVRQMPIKAVFSARAFKIISSFSGVSERDLGEGAHARRHTLQNKRSVSCWVRP